MAQTNYFLRGDEYTMRAYIQREKGGARLRGHLGPTSYTGAWIAQSL
jgi:hypothetical protein